MQLHNNFISACSVMSAGFLNGSMISVTRGASFSVSYNIAIQNGIDNTKLNRAELWVYPETQENATLVDLYVQIRAETPNVSRLVTRRPGHTWMTQDRCIPLDVTLAVKKLFRALHKRGQSSALVKITVSITNVLTRTDPLLRERISDNICQALTTGCNQKQFLVLKYSKPKSTGNGELRPGITEPLVSTPPPATSDRNTNSNTTTTTAPPSSLPTTSKQPCEVEDYYINLNSSAFIPVSPNRLNIKHCSGMCSATDIRKFTAHGQLKKEFSDLSSCCVPTELSDTTIVINQNGVMMSILLSDAIVKQCSCR